MVTDSPLPQALITDIANFEHCQDLAWANLHIGPPRRDWARCSRCRQYLTRILYDEPGRFTYIHHVEAKNG